VVPSMRQTTWERDDLCHRRVATVAAGRWHSEPSVVSLNSMAKAPAVITASLRRRLIQLLFRPDAVRIELQRFCECLAGLRILVLLR
jgi:hypothetical protein